MDNHIRKKVCEKARKKEAEKKCQFPGCGKVFTRVYNRIQHQLAEHKYQTRHKAFRCDICSKMFQEENDMKSHRKNAHPFISEFEEKESAHNHACELFSLELPENITTMPDASDYCLPKTKRLLKQKLFEKKRFKYQLLVNATFTQDVDKIENTDLREGGERTITVFLTTNMREIFDRNHINSSLVQSWQQVARRAEDFEANGSGWVLIGVSRLDVVFGTCNPLAGSAQSCQMHFADNPTIEGDIVIKERIIKQKEEEKDGDEESEKRCFFKAVGCYFVAKNNNISLDCVTEDAVDQFLCDNVNECVSTPVNIKSIPFFEESNSHLDFAINVVYQDEEKKIFPTYASKNWNALHKVNLLLFHTDEGDMHYALIADMNRFLAKNSFYNNRLYRKNRELCYNCLITYMSKSALERHVEWCHQEKGQRYVLPEPGDVVKYKRGEKESKIGYIFFFDFETLQLSPGENEKKNGSKTNVLSLQKPFAYHLLLVKRDGKVEESITYVGEDAALHFLETLIRVEEKYIAKMKEVVPMVLSCAEKLAFQKAFSCYICRRPLNGDKVRDHDHITGQFLGAAHNLCNLHRIENLKLVGFAHNFSGYDSHLLVSAIDDYRKLKKGFLKINVIPLNQEKFKMMQINNCVLLDSLAFLNAGLDKLIETLKLSNHDFNILKQWISKESDQALLLRKGVYPYEFVTSLEKVKNTIELPEKTEFFSRLNESNISDRDYQHAQNVWKTFECQSLEDYTKLYVKADCYQLAEAVINLRNNVYDEFNIDLCHYLSLPMLTKDIMLKVTGVKLELMCDIDMIHIFKSNLRGGLSFINVRHFDIVEEAALRGTKFVIIYLDANNL